MSNSLPSLLLTLISSLSGLTPALAQSTEYFNNPLNDSRIHFESCAIEGALYGLLNKNHGDVLCFGYLKEGNRRIAAHWEQKTRSKRYYSASATKLTFSSGNSSAGVEKLEVHLKPLSHRFTSIPGGRTTTLKVINSWLYRQSTTTLSGELPDVKKSLFLQLYHLHSLDDEVNQLKRDVH